MFIIFKLCDQNSRSAVVWLYNEKISGIKAHDTQLASTLRKKNS